MSLSQEQLKHDRVNLRRLVKRLEVIVSTEQWASDEENEETWVKVNGISQSIRYARQLLLNVDTYDELDPQSSTSIIQKRRLDSIRETLNRLDRVVDVVKNKLESQSKLPTTSYLSLVSLPKEPPSAGHNIDASPEAELIPVEGPSTSIAEREVDLASELLPESQPERVRSMPSQTPATALFGASTKTHEELSEELARMAEQLKKNTLYFSDSLEKDKSVLESASEVIEKNYNSLTTQQSRLKTHGGKSFWTTWMTLGSIIGVCIAWVLVFIMIRLT
ncbi:hypothetical protein M422DRAFT_204934 [Sphaerobolus stellatus SS14]|nr:hypothetical protein M422DRAFT_204934 [Sphaerobolus stellatus SS14]